MALLVEHNRRMGIVRRFDAGSVPNVGRGGAGACRSAVIGHQVIGHRVVGHRSSVIGRRSAVGGRRSSVVGHRSVPGW
jgi:hypothetical protein